MKEEDQMGIVGLKSQNSFESLPYFLFLFPILPPFHKNHKRKFSVRGIV